MKYFIPSILCLFFIVNANAQMRYGYDTKSNSDNFGIFASLSSSSSSSLIEGNMGGSNTVKGANSTVPAIGLYYQKGFGSRFSVRVGFSLGHTSNAYKYAAAYDSIGANFEPLNTVKYSKYKRYKTPTSFVQPQIELGYVFGPIKDMYLIEVRGGIGLQAYLSKNSDTVISTKTSVTSRKLAYTTQYYFLQSARFGDPDVYGSIVTNLYVGFKWQRMENVFLNRFSIGIQATIPITNESAGYAKMEYKDASKNSIGTETIYLSQYSFGIRAAYNFL